MDTILELKNGTTIRSNSKEYTAGDFVSIHDQDGNEVAYWDAQEWKDEPVQVMGAILLRALREDRQYE